MCACMDPVFKVQRSKITGLPVVTDEQLWFAECASISGLPGGGEYQRFSSSKKGGVGGHRQQTAACTQGKGPQVGKTLKDKISALQAASATQRTVDPAQLWDAGMAIAHEQVDQPCSKCGLPLGEIVYFDERGKPALHGECMAQLTLRTVQESEKIRQKDIMEKKRIHQRKYDIGWKVERIPRNFAPLKRLELELSSGHGFCGLVFQEWPPSVSIEETLNPAACVNLEYLSIALTVRREEGREPLFSLDPPVDEKPMRHLKDTEEKPKHVKRFEPWWLAGTSVGEVMFQADYYLKELSMGEYEQPVTGMKSCFEFSEEEGLKEKWMARAWFVVNDAKIYVSNDNNFLVPYVDMGVEAREQRMGPNGIQDAKVTRPDHPLVKYTEDFSHNFDLIAERKSVVHHLRDLAKASVLAKFLVESKLRLKDSWFNMVDWHAAEEAAAQCCMEVPHSWHDRLCSHLHLQDGAIVGANDRINSVYGGVQFGLDRVSPQLISGLGTGVEAPFAAHALPGQPIGGYIPLPRARAAPKGVDLNLDKFGLIAPERLGLEGSTHAGIGNKFWSIMNSKDDSTIDDANLQLLKEIYKPQLSDRRNEGDLFIGLDNNPSYLKKLHSLVTEEAQVKQQRKDHFLSADFVSGNAGPLFPLSWTSSIEIACRRVPRQLHGHPNHKINLSDLKPSEILFDQSTVDGVRFRIYKHEAFEVRTTQEYKNKEVIGVVFSTDVPAPTEQKCPTSHEHEQVVKATRYVEASSLPLMGHHYYTVFETESGAIVMAEMLPSEAVIWEENPRGMEERNSKAKVIDSKSYLKTKVKIHDMICDSDYITQAAASSSADKTYSQLIYNRVTRGNVR